MSDNPYLEVISLVERLHRHFLEVVKLELDGLGIHDINNVQGDDAVQYRRRGDDGRRADPARLLSRLERVVQRQEDGRERLSGAGALGARPPLDPCAADRQGAQRCATG